MTLPVLRKHPAIVGKHEPIRSLAFTDDTIIFNVRCSCGWLVSNATFSEREHAIDAHWQGIVSAVSGA